MLKRWYVYVTLLCFMLMVPHFTEGASKQYVNPESSILFADSAQTPAATWTLSALASGAGRISARYDRGTGAHSAFYKWRCWAALTGTNVVGATVEYYIATGDGTHVDGEIGTADASLATDKRRNLTLLGILSVDQTTTNVAMTTSGLVYIPDRYVSLGVWNATTLPFKTDTAISGCNLIPMPMEQQ